MRSVSSIKMRLAILKDEETRIHKYYRGLGRMLTAEEQGEWGQEAGAIKLEINVLNWVLSTKAPEANRILLNKMFQ